MSERVTFTQVVTRTYKVDVEELRRDFREDIEADLGTTDVSALPDSHVVKACWDGGVRQPYFELQAEEAEAL